MKVIDLLNKIANGEEIPELVKYKNYIYIYDKDICDYKSDDYYLFDNTDKLNDEVEIIEEDKKIEKIKNINIDYCIDGKLYEHLTKEEIALDIQTIRHKLDEIIDYINKEK